MSNRNSLCPDTTKEVAVDVDLIKSTIAKDACERAEDLEGLFSITSDVALNDK